MRVQKELSLALLAAILPSFTSALIFDCSNVRVDNVRFDLSPLGGVHRIYHVEELEEKTVNTTYTLNICNILKGAAPKGCAKSKNVCGYEETTLPDGVMFARGFSIAGSDHLGGGSKDPEFTRLKKQDSETEGVRVKIGGGEIYDPDQKAENPVSAVIEFQCDPDRTGLEGLSTEEVDDTEDAKRRRTRRDDEDEDDGNNEDKGNGDKDVADQSLRFKSFGPVDDKSYVLRLDWKTKYACENYVRDNPSESSGGGHWGFFTWLIIILFLLVAAYLIFGSWLNYNRYGARGWDLLPHGDTIRDIPYIFQDWVRRVVNTLHGPGARGGYAAV